MRKFFAKVHLWLSIPFGIIIAIVCLTGAILVFETEILELGYPSRYFVKEVKGEPLSPAALIESARQQFGYRLTRDELINWYYRGKRPRVLLIPTPGR